MNIDDLAQMAFCQRAMVDSTRGARHVWNEEFGTDLTMLPQSTLNEAEALLVACRSKGIMVATAESCTGGLIVAALTAIAGSSDVVDRGFVTYSNEAKNQMIGVPMALIEAHGAVSQPVAAAMAA